MILNPKIFRAYDIRGESFIDFDEDGFFVIAAAFGKYIADKFKIEKPKLFVSGDGRNSMGELYPAVIAGLELANCEVTWGGTIPTPINYFAFHEGDFNASIQITASHNPAQDNGLKLTDQNGAVCGDEIQKIRKLAECTECRKTKDFGECTAECHAQEYAEKYFEKLTFIQSKIIAKKLVVDAGNGVAGMYYPALFEKMGHQVTQLFCDLDGNFPNHQPDPERPENLKDLITKVQEEKADWGFAFDGDGDRVGIVNGNGEILSADKILFVLATDFLSRNPGEKIVLDIMCSPILMDKIEKLGGQVIRSKTGHSFIEENMKAEKAFLGGEQSGHFMFGENFYGHDDAMLASLRFLEAIENNPDLITEITDNWPEMLEFSEKFTSPDEQKFEVLKNVTKQLISDFENSDVQIDTIDGIRLDFGDQEWAIIRCSNTSPKIAIRIEARSAESLDEKKEMLVGVLEKFNQ